jgi:excisionase family DNA binding protein
MAKKQVEAVEKESDGLLTLREAAGYLGVTDQRIRTLLRTGRVPAQKNEKGYWRVATEALDKYNATKGQRTSGKKAYVAKLSPEQLEMLQALCEDEDELNDVEFAPRYNYDPEKAKAYRLARAEKLAAEEAAAEAEAES